MGQLPTLSDFYYGVFETLWIDAKQLDPKTRKSYRESIAHWCRITGDPSIDTIDDMVVAKFISALCNLPGKQTEKMKFTSVQKHCRSIDTVLKTAGPRSRTNRKGQTLIPEPPFVEGPRVDQEAPSKDWTLAEIRAMYLAADSMKKRPIHAGVNTGDWWRAFVVTAYFTGMRIKSLISFEYSMIHESWLVATAKISKRRKGKKIYLRREVLEHIEKIRGTENREVVLAWVGDWDRYRRVCYDELRRLQAAAGIPKHRRFAFQSFRKTYLTELALGGDPQQGIKNAQTAAGHTSSAITTGHYISGTAQDLLYARSVEAMRDPFDMTITL